MRVPNENLSCTRRLVAQIEPDEPAARLARRAMHAQQRARFFARIAKRSVGEDRIYEKVRAGRAAQSAEALAEHTLRPTIVVLQGA